MPEPGPDDVTSAPSRSRRRRKRRSWARRRHLGLLTTGAAALILVVGLLLVVVTWDHGRTDVTRQIAAAASSAAAVSSAAATGSTPPATGATTAPSTGATPTPSATSRGPGSDQASSVRGAITAVGNDTWTLAGANGVDYRIVVTADTTYGKRRSFGSYVVGDTVAVKGILDQGTVTAQSVTPVAAAS